MAVDLLGRSVYVATQGNSYLDGVVWTYHIGPDGSLTPVAGSPFAVGTFSFSGGGEEGQVGGAKRDGAKRDRSK